MLPDGGGWSAGGVVTQSLSVRLTGKQHVLNKCDQISWTMIWELCAQEERFTWSGNLKTKRGRVDVCSLSSSSPCAAIYSTFIREGGGGGCCRETVVATESIGGQFYKKH